jgi:signal transduction histidine kinase
VIAALNMNLVPLESQLKKLHSDLVPPVTESISLLDDLSSGLRTISHLLHPPLLDEAGLTSAIQWYVEGFAERSKIPVALEIASDLGRLSVDLETTVFRIVQEALTNIHRHSGSATASIVLRRENHGLRLEICDQGKGVALSPSGSVRPGVGIQGMRERIRQLGGAFEIRPGSPGTIVSAFLPEVNVSAQKAS